MRARFACTLLIVLCVNAARGAFAQEQVPDEGGAEPSAGVPDEEPAPAAEGGTEASPPAVLGVPDGGPVGTDSQPSAAASAPAGNPTVPFIEPEPIDDAASAAVGPAPHGPRIHVGALLGFGVSFDDTVGSINPLGFGLGVRGDYRLLDRLAVGGRFVYFLGGSASLPTGEISMSSWILAGEISHVLSESGLIIEPGIAIGLAGTALDGRLTAADTGGGFIPGTTDQARVGFYLAPGATVILPLALLLRELDPVFIAADGRVGLLFRNSLSGSLELMLNAGARF